MSGVNPARLRRYFQPTDEGYEVVPRLREFIRFEGLNLATPIFTKVHNASHDVILCRNVIIYFDLPTIRGLMDRFLAALKPGGLLLLGYSESLFKVYDKFEMVEVEGAFIYRRPPEEVNRRRALEPIVVPKLSHPVRPPPPESRRKFVPELPPAPVAARANAPTLLPPQRLSNAVTQMERGDFSGALTALQKLTEDAGNDLDALITLGNIYSLMGRNAEAREIFAQVLSREPLCVEARIFGGVAALQAGALEDARSELSKALFLEPTLALGHYLLAQAHERSADREGARRSYRNAIAQVKVPQRNLAGHYPDMPDSAEAIARAARYALAALEEA
jgi:chemotaxis protein methyltransferase CheR